MHDQTTVDDDDTAGAMTVDAGASDNWAALAPHSGSVPPAPAAQPSVTEPHAQSLLEQLVAGTFGPLTRLQERLDTTLEQAADWIRHPDNRRQIVDLVALLDAQSQLLASQHRVYALARLIELSRDDATPPETIRRACAEVLRLRLIDPYKEDKREQPPIVVHETQAQHQRILAALDAIGRGEELE